MFFSHSFRAVLTQLHRFHHWPPGAVSWYWVCADVVVKCQHLVLMWYWGLCVVGTGPCQCKAGARGWLVFGVLGVEVSSHIVLANFDALTIVEPAY